MIEEPCPPSSGGQGTPSVEAEVVKSEMNECIHGKIDRLPENYRTVVILSELQGLKDKEIAEILQCSVENVRIRLHRARKRLRQILESDCTFDRDEESNLQCDKK